MAKFYAHELLLGQINLMLGVLLMGALVAIPPIARSLPVDSSALPCSSSRTRSFCCHGCSSRRVGSGRRRCCRRHLVACVPGCGLRLERQSGSAQWMDGDGHGLNGAEPSGNDNVSIAAMWAKWLGPGPLAWPCVADYHRGHGLVIVAWQRRRSVTAPEYLEWAFLMLLMPLFRRRAGTTCCCWPRRPSSASSIAGPS